MRSPRGHSTSGRRTTIRELAAAAHLDPSTVSRALAGKAGVKPETRALVERLAERMDYQPNALAQGLRSRRSGIVGLVVPDLRNEWYTTLAAVMEVMLARSGYVMQLSVSRDDAARERDATRMLADHQAAGIILAPRGRHLPAVPGLLARIPLVEVSRYTDAATDKVYADDETAAYDATRHLLDLGHRRIALVMNARGLTTSQNRLQGYTRALHAAGVPVEPDMVQAGENSIAWGARATATLLRSAQPPTAAIAGGHLITLGALEIVAELGRHVPDELSLLAFDHAAWMPAWPGGITAMRAPWEDMAKAAVDLLLERIAIMRGEQPAREPVVKVFAYAMVTGGSTGTPRMARAA
jgi:LacI family transcriptional regulator